MGVVPLAALVVLICLALGAMATSAPRSAIRRFLKISALLVIAGCFVAACDGLNDEGWEPWFFASFFVAPFPAIYMRLVSSPPRPVWLVLLAVFAILILWVALVLAGTVWQHWALQHGIPASW